MIAEGRNHLAGLARPAIHIVAGSSCCTHCVVGDLPCNRKKIDLVRMRRPQNVVAAPGFVGLGSLQMDFELMELVG